MQKFRLFAALALLAFAGMGCSKLLPTAPTRQDHGSETSPIVAKMTMTMHAAIEAPAPTPTDSLFIIWGDTWQTETFVGYLTNDGHIDRDYHTSIAAEGETHQLRFTFAHNGVHLPAYGSFGINGIPMTAIDQDTTGWVIWYSFKANRDQSNNLVVDPIRDDTAFMQWSQIWVTGIDTPPGSHDHASTGDQNMVFASTFSNLKAVPGVFDNNTWKTYIWSKRGQKVLLRPMNGDTDPSVWQTNPPGALARSGVYFINADNTTPVLAENFFDMDSSPNSYYAAYRLLLKLDGTWTNTSTHDDRWGDITIR